jgi:hypothetical protein
MLVALHTREKMIVDSDILWKMMDNLSGYPHLPHHLDNCFTVTHTINNTATILIKFNEKQ